MLFKFSGLQRFKKHTLVCSLPSHIKIWSISLLTSTPFLHCNNPSTAHGAIGGGKQEDEDSFFPSNHSLCYMHRILWLFDEQQVSYFIAFSARHDHNTNTVFFFVYFPQTSIQSKLPFSGRASSDAAWLILMTQWMKRLELSCWVYLECPQSVFSNFFPLWLLSAATYL